MRVLVKYSVQTTAFRIFSTSNTHVDIFRSARTMDMSVNLDHINLWTVLKCFRTVTKGDNNPTDDIGLYNGLKYLKRSNIIGKVDGYLPYVGYVTIAMVSLSLFRCTIAKHCC